MRKHTTPRDEFSRSAPAPAGSREVGARSPEVQIERRATVH
jgi:hypothetical protein